MNSLQILYLSKTKTIFFVFAFTVLSVAMPMLAHYFGGQAAGQMFLPMHFFVLVGGLLLGRQAGLAIGILTPLISYFLTGMPPIMILPFVVIEVAAYGFLAGLLREKFKNIWLSLAGAMVSGRIILWLSIMVLPTKLSAMPYIIGALQAGWRGIALQIILVPVVVITVRKFLWSERV